MPYSRRSLLRTGLLGGSAAALATAGGVSTVGLARASTPQADTAAASTAPSRLQNLFTLTDLDFDTLFAFGGTGYGSAEFGELVTAVNAINRSRRIPAPGSTS